MKDAKLGKYNPKDAAINRPCKSKGHGSVMAGKAKVKKGKKAKR